MAGSYHHCRKHDGEFTFDLIDDLGDAYEACEEMFWIIHFMAGGDLVKTAVAREYAWEKIHPHYTAKAL